METKLEGTRANKPFLNKPLKIEGEKENFFLNQKWKVKRIWEKVISIEYEQRRVNKGETRVLKKETKAKGQNKYLKL